jgi:hypothetical protein
MTAMISKSMLFSLKKAKMNKSAEGGIRTHKDFSFVKENPCQKKTHYLFVRSFLKSSP